MNRIGKAAINGLLIIAAGVVTLLNGKIIKNELETIKNEKLIVFDAESFEEVQ